MANLYLVGVIETGGYWLPCDVGKIQSSFENMTFRRILWLPPLLEVN